MTIISEYYNEQTYMRLVRVESVCACVCVLLYLVPHFDLFGKDFHRKVVPGVQECVKSLSQAMSFSELQKD